jgi:hypothetical protein
VTDGRLPGDARIAERRASSRLSRDVRLPATARLQQIPCAHRDDGDTLPVVARASTFNP